MDLNNLEKLTQLNGVSGREDAVRAEIAAQLQALGLPAHTDVLGNLIAYRKGTGPHKIILCAHMDEVGLMVKYISPDGFFVFHYRGGHRPAHAAGPARDGAYRFGADYGRYRHQAGAYHAGSRARQKPYRFPICLLTWGCPARRRRGPWRWGILSRWSVLLCVLETGACAPKLLITA